jgi:hypothetical protein
MRILFLILLLANLAFFAWDRYLRAPVDVRERIRQVEITPEKIRVLGPPVVTKAESEPAKAEKEALAAKPAACLEWGAFIGNEAARADAAIAESALPADRIQRVVSELTGYWVLIPPLKTRADITAASAKLKEQGITDFSVVQEPERRRNAISLGIFRTEEAAQTLLNAVRKKGVADAVLERRENFFRQVVYYLREPDKKMVGQWNTLRLANPGTEVKAVTCPL